MKDKITIQGEDYSMTVYLEPFLLGKGRSITDVKRLVKVIRGSNSPEVLEELKGFAELKHREAELLCGLSAWIFECDKQIGIKPRGHMWTKFRAIVRDRDFLAKVLREIG